MKIIKRVGERLPSWLHAEVRPILAFTGAGTALLEGSRIMVRRIWRYLSRRLEVWERLGVVAFGGYVAVYGCVHAPDEARFVVPGAVVAWCASAWWHAPPAELPPTPETAVERPPAAPSQDVQAATLDWIRRQIGDRQGVHLRDLLEHAQAHGMFEGLDVTEFRGHLERHGIPVRNRVRVRGLGVTVGVYRDDLPPLPRPSPERGAQTPPDSELHGA